MSPKLINLIYDLPPNSDGYTEAFFEEVFNLSEKNNKIILYLVYNSDSMLKCNLDWLNTFLCGNNLKKCSIVLVNNSEFLNISNHDNGLGEKNTLNQSLKRWCPIYDNKNTWLYSFGDNDDIRAIYNISSRHDDLKDLLSRLKIPTFSTLINLEESNKIK